MAGWYDDDDDYVELSEEGQQLVEQGWRVHEETVFDPVFRRKVRRRRAVRPPGKAVLSARYRRLVDEGWVDVREETAFDESENCWVTKGVGWQVPMSGMSDKWEKETWEFGQCDSPGNEPGDDLLGLNACWGGGSRVIRVALDADAQHAMVLGVVAEGCRLLLGAQLWVFVQYTALPGGAAVPSGLQRPVCPPPVCPPSDSSAVRFRIAGRG